jgi:hypothetical protein
MAESSEANNAMLLGVFCVEFNKEALININVK